MVTASNTWRYTSASKAEEALAKEIARRINVAVEHTIDFDRYNPCTRVEERETKRMLILFDVVIVDPEEEKIVWEDRVLSLSSSGAKTKAWVSAELGDEDPDDYDFIVMKLGDVRTKE